MPMKPHIAWNLYLQLWCCGPKEWSYTGSGFGDTPSQAFADWKEHIARMKSR